MPRFPKSARLLVADEFAEVRQKGRQARSGCITVVTIKASCARLGLIVPRRVGNAVARNRIKRVIREYFRLNRDAFPRGDCVVIPAGGAAKLSNDAIRSQLVRALERLKA